MDTASAGSGLTLFPATREPSAAASFRRGRGGGPGKPRARRTADRASRFAPVPRMPFGRDPISAAIADPAGPPVKKRSGPRGGSEGGRPTPGRSEIRFETPFGPAAPHGEAGGIASSVPVERVRSDPALRFDATHYDPAVDAVVGGLRASGLLLSPLSDLASLHLPGQFTRVWAKDAEHGIPYLNATDLLSLFALGLPSAGPRFLSRYSETDLEALRVREGWLLMTCSGTIGRVFAMPGRLDGWAATHDLIRIVPPRGMVGYLFAWCSTPAARAQILSHTHGGQIDHVTEEQVAGLLVPRLSAKRVREIDRKVVEALEARERALEDLLEAWAVLPPGHLPPGPTDG